MLIGKECNDCAILAILESALALSSSGMTILRMIRWIQTVSLAQQAVFLQILCFLTKLLLKYFSHSTEETEFGLLLQEATALSLSHVFSHAYFKLRYSGREKNKRTKLGTAHVIVEAFHFFPIPNSRVQWQGFSGAPFTSQEKRPAAGRCITICIIKKEEWSNGPQPLPSWPEIPQEPFTSFFGSTEAL